MATLDLGHLLLVDTDPVNLSECPPSSEKFYRRVVGNFCILKDALSQLPFSKDEDGASVTLPEPLLAVPRAFTPAVPKSERPPTKWEAFAKKKGIQPKRKRSSHVYDETISKEWRPRHGPKSTKNDSLSNWVQELN